jgi:hypothetical protein
MRPRSPTIERNSLRMEVFMRRCLKAYYAGARRRESPTELTSS